jgi:hypothetical protein
MNITLNPVQSRAKAQAAVTKAQDALKSSKWHALANGDFGQSRVGEGKLMLAREENHIKQLQDIANHASSDPTVEILAYNAYAEKDTLKANGFRWNGADKCWYKAVKVVNLDATLTAIGAAVDDAEKILAGL